ncbi:MAG: amino acid ABC transporter permease [Clostridia bacterium]
MNINFFRVIEEAMPMLLQGMGMTVKLTVLSLLMAIVLGLISCFMNISKFKVLRGIAKFYLWIIRGTPLLVQVFFVYFGLTQGVQVLLTNIGSDAVFRLTPFMAGFITLSLNAGAYMSEIFRAGIQAIDKGQMEAARSLGLSKWRAMMKVILPQAIKICIPSLVNQFIITLKDTSIISVISFADVVYQAKIYIGRTMESFATWIVVGILYLIVISVLSWISSAVERRLHNDGKKG